MTFRFQGSVCSDLNDIKIFIRKVLNRLENVIHDKSLMFDIKLILNELIINSVIHGNEYNRGKCVNLFLEIVEGTLRIEVKDEGQGIDLDELCCDQEELKCCGRGLVIVDGLSDEVYIDRNKVVAVKHII